ncbi:MAG: DUF1998 domain-containing protein [Deltaproteobacteria bacterium]|nr:DUF1998 domain-containing protein [Deltaproteobacteria bacterium]
MMIFGLAFLHPLHSWKLHLIAWTLPFLGLLLGAMLSYVAVGSGRGSRLARSLFSMGHAALSLGALFTALRLLAWIDGWGDGPQRWAFGWVTFFWPEAEGLWLHPYDTLFLVSAGASLAVMVVAPLASVVDPPSPAHPPRLNAPVPGSTWASLALAAGALALPLLFFHGAAEDVDSWRLLDLLGLAPALALTVALRLHAHIPLPAAAVMAEVAAPWPVRRPDLGARWIQSGVAEATPLLTLPSTLPPSGSPEGWVQGLWDAAGGVGPAPAALERLTAPALPPLARLLGDVPMDTEGALFTAAALHAVLVRRERVLAVVPDPDALAELLLAGLGRSSSWSPGVITTSADALREAIARRRLPVAVFVSPSDLSERLIRLLNAEGREWLLGLGLILVHRPDLGTPIQVSHTAFTFARWHLSTAHLALPQVIATGPDTPEAIAHLAELFPGRAPRPCELGPRVQALPTVLRVTAGAARGAEPWVSLAAREAAALGQGSVILDPVGRWSELHLRAVPRTPHLRPTGGASLAELAPGHLAEAWRSLGNRLPDGPHWSLWSLPASPASSFLLAPQRLEQLAEARALPVPAPVVGRRNRFLRVAHTQAALHEGPPDELSLRRVFGEEVVDFVLLRAERGEAHRARLEGREVVRSPLVRATQQWEDPHRRTVTPRAVAVVSDQLGTVLDEVDEDIASTRYYPTRVFASEGRLYQVPLHALDAKRSQIRVQSASPGLAPTKPRVEFALDDLQPLVDPVTHRDRDLRFTGATFSAWVSETIRSAWVPELDREQHFDPVRARYHSTVLAVILPDAVEGKGLSHLAATVDELVQLFLRTTDEDCEVVAAGPAQTLGLGTGLLFIDRHIEGMGIATALHPAALTQLLRWAHQLLFECPCLEGCPRCTAEQILKDGPDKQGAMRLLRR